ncbi:MAG: MtrB/PioB family outer membrane beta-barrel protein, partial [Burkholderiales bacterium]
MRLMRQPTILALLALVLVPAPLFSQEQPAPPAPPSHGSVEFGVRQVWGDVYGRPDLPFTPDVITSKFNEYGDRRNGFVVPKFHASFDDILGSKNYVSVQSQSTFYKNQSFLATFGRYGKFKFQVRYDETPHIYTNTARSLYVETGRGVYTILPGTKQILQDRSSMVCATPPCTAARIGISLPGFVTTQVVPGENFIVPSIQRKAVTGLASWDITPNWNASFLFSRENEVGTRPIGQLFNSGPSASASSQPSSVAGRQSPGTGAELPEPIDYFITNVKVMTEYGKNDWGVQLGYTGSFFQNNIDALVFDNPFATADVGVQLIANGTEGCTTTGGRPNCVIGAVPSRGQVDLYPDNQAHTLNFAWAFDAGKYVRVMGTINPGWRRQNDPFLPYSANSQIFFPDSAGALTIPATTLSLLPAPSLNGQRQTLAVNYTAVFSPLK